MYDSTLDDEIAELLGKTEKFNKEAGLALNLSKCCSVVKKRVTRTCKFEIWRKFNSVAKFQYLCVGGR